MEIAKFNNEESLTGNTRHHSQLSHNGRAASNNYETAIKKQLRSCHLHNNYSAIHPSIKGGSSLPGKDIHLRILAGNTSFCLCWRVRRHHFWAKKGRHIPPKKQIMIVGQMTPSGIKRTGFCSRRTIFRLLYPFHHFLRNGLLPGPGLPGPILSRSNFRKNGGRETGGRGEDGGILDDEWDFRHNIPILPWPELIGKQQMKRTATFRSVAWTVAQLTGSRALTTVSKSSYLRGYASLWRVITTAKSERSINLRCS